MGQNFKNIEAGPFFDVLIKKTSVTVSPINTKIGRLQWQGRQSIEFFPLFNFRIPTRLYSQQAMQLIIFVYQYSKHAGHNEVRNTINFVGIFIF